MIDVLLNLPSDVLNAWAFWLALFHCIMDIGIIIYLIRKSARAQNTLKHVIDALKQASEPTQQEIKELLQMDDFKHV